MTNKTYQKNQEKTECFQLTATAAAALLFLLGFILRFLFL
jgi:hypothetical protein